MLKVICSDNIIVSRHTDYTIYSKDDGVDYTAVWLAFRQGTLRGVSVLRLVDYREVYCIELASRKLILKIDRYVPRGLEKKLRHMFFGPFFSKQMRAVNKAVRQGCCVVPDIFFVAERKRWGLVTESYMIQEFMEGTHFADEKEVRAQAGEVITAVRELHAYNLAHCDLNLDNMMQTDGGVGFIDLSCSGSTFGGKGKDYVRLQERFNIAMPLKSLSEKLAYGYTIAKFALQNCIRGGKQR